MAQLGSAPEKDTRNERRFVCICLFHLKSLPALFASTEPTRSPTHAAVRFSSSSFRLDRKILPLQAVEVCPTGQSQGHDRYFSSVVSNLAAVGSFSQTSSGARLACHPRGATQSRSRRSSSSLPLSI